MLLSWGEWVKFDWEAGVKPIICHERSCLDSLRELVVCRKLSYRQVLNPVISLVVDVGAKVLFHDSIELFRLSVRLRVVSC